jgi:putative lipoprotein
VHGRLEDVSLADAPAVLVGEQRFLARGRQVPLPFAVIFDPSDIDPRHTYNVSATIAEPGGRVLFRTTRAFRVITRDAPQFDVEVVLDLAR